MTWLPLDTLSLLVAFVKDTWTWILIIGVSLIYILSYYV